MKEVPLSDPHMKKHFDFFNGMNHPHFSITSKIKLGDIKSFAKLNHSSVHFTLAYFISKTANDIKEFRRRIRDDKMVEHDAVHPSFTVETAKSETFSFCTVPFSQDFGSFNDNAKEIYEKMQSNPSFEDEPGRDDFLFLSSIPWIDFSSITHAMHYHPHDSVPRITWGKLIKKKKGYRLSVSVQAHHAIIDGKQVANFFMLLEKYLKSI